MSNNSNLSRLAPRLNADGTYPKTQGFQLITSGSANWTVPAQVTFIKATVVGAGGAGGGVIGAAATKGPGGGGGGGAWGVFYLNVFPGSLIPYQVGAGGTGVAGANGNAGGNSSFNGSTINGGGGGLLYTNTETDNRGLGGSNPILLPAQGYGNEGGNGSNGAGNTTQAFSGAGGGSMADASRIYFLARFTPDTIATAGKGILGGRGANPTSATSNAAVFNGNAAPSGFGNGGSGASILTASTSTSNAQGGAGSGGAILIEWY